MIVWIVEDDHEQAAYIADAVLEEFPQSEVEKVRNEAEFRARLKDITSTANVVVMDVILRWTDASPTMAPRPDEVRFGGADRAGFRCLAMLRADPRTETVPVILYSVLDVSTFSNELAELARQNNYFTKEDNHQRLIQAMAAALKKLRQS